MSAAVTHFVENLNRGGLERTVIDLVRTQRASGQSATKKITAAAISGVGL